MEIKTLIVKPKLGFGNLNFGQSMSEAQGEYPSTVWHYWSHGFSLFFDHAHQKSFTCAEIDNHSALLWECKIFELKENEIIALFREKGFYNNDEEKHEWGEKRLSFDDAMIDFYFENGKMTSINFGIQVEHNQDKVLILPN